MNLADDQQVAQLREAAVEATARRWAVVPGTWLDEQGQWRGREGARALCPASATWQQEMITDSRVAAAVWSQPRGLLLGFDACVHALEMPRSLGEWVFPVLMLWDLVGPVIELGERWALLMEAGRLTFLGALLAGVHPSLVLCGKGDWVALPPTRTETAVASWYVAPSQRLLPKQEDVLRAVASTLLPEWRP